MPIQLSSTTNIALNDQFEGVNINEKTMPAIKSFFESKGAVVTNKADGSISIALGWYDYVTRKPISFTKEELAEYVTEAVPQESVIQAVSPLVGKLTFQYSMQTAKDKASDAVTVIRNNKGNLLKVLAGISALTAVAGVASYAYSKHKAKV